MIKVVYAIFIITIKDLKVHLSNSNLPTEKSVICFQVFAQKERWISKWLVHYITNTKSLFYRSICLSWENLGQNSPFASTSNCFNPQEMGCQEGGWGGGVKNSEIVAIPNQYKNTLDDFIDNLDLKLPDWAGPIDEKSRNAPMSENSLADFLGKDCLDEDLLDKLSQLAPKIGDLKVHQHCVIAPRVRKSWKGRKNHSRNKINTMVGKSSNTEASAYHNIIDRY